MSRHDALAPPSAVDWPDRATYGAIFVLGAILFWLSYEHPSAMPVWAPWDFSPSIYLATALTLYWYWRGLALSPAAARPSIWRRVAFLLGLFLIYAVLQTRFEYWSQHMFFLNRIQSLAMHDIGPFLIALAWPGAMIEAGMPPWIRRFVKSRFVTTVGRVCGQPAMATFLFIGIFYLWLIPAVHFLAMIDHRLYAVMNWSMIIGGLLFWCLVLDPRPKPPARLSFGMRGALALGVTFPQTLLGAVITFVPRDLYSFYDLCGRLFPSISPLSDQRTGGIVSWIPAGMMSTIGLVLVLNFLRLHEETTTETQDEESASLAALATRWTGR
ncbi:MAG: cytochrome c oxidase assembly protein [Methylovirgula sp.]